MVKGGGTLVVTEGLSYKVCFAERYNKTTSCSDIILRSQNNEIILRSQNSDITLQAT